MLGPYRRKFCKGREQLAAGGAGRDAWQQQAGLVPYCARGAQGRQAGLTGVLDDLAQPVHDRPSQHAAQAHVEQVVLQAGGGRETRRGKAWPPVP